MELGKSKSIVFIRVFNPVYRHIFSRNFNSGGRQTVDKSHSFRNEELSSSKYQIPQPAFVGKLKEGVPKKSVKFTNSQKSTKSHWVLASECLNSPVCAFNPYILKKQQQQQKNVTKKPPNLPKKPNLHLFDKSNRQDFAMHIVRDTQLNNFSTVFGYQLYETCT